MSPFLTETLIALGLLILAVLLGIWIGSLIWKKYKNLADEWSREYHEKLETYTSLQEAHDTLNEQYNKDKESLEGLQAKLAFSVNKRSELEQNLGEIRQQVEQAHQQVANAQEEAAEVKRQAATEVESLKAELEAQKHSAPAPEVQVPIETPKVIVHERPADMDRGEADRQRLTELESSIGRLKNQILLLMPFQGKFERALKEMEALKRSEASMKEKLSRAQMAADVSKKALEEAGKKSKQLSNIENLYANSQDQIHKLNLALGIVRPYKEKAEKLEKQVKTLDNKIKRLTKPSQTAKPQTKTKAAPKPKAPAKPKVEVKAKPVKKASPKAEEKAKPEKKASPKPKRTNKKDTLARIKAKAGEVDFGRIGTAKASEKDDLKKIKGIGPFLEEKLNSIGIYTFDQISRFTPTIEKKVNEIIEFFPGRIKRDGWKRQATTLVKAKNKK